MASEKVFGKLWSTGQMSLRVPRCEEEGCGSGRREAGIPPTSCLIFSRSGTIHKVWAQLPLALASRAPSKFREAAQRVQGTQQGTREAGMGSGRHHGSAWVLGLLFEAQAPTPENCQVTATDVSSSAFRC